MENQAYVELESIIADTVSIPIAGISFLAAEFFLLSFFFVIVLTFHSLLFGCAASEPIAEFTVAVLCFTLCFYYNENITICQ